MVTMNKTTDLTYMAQLLDLLADYAINRGFDLQTGFDDITEVTWKSPGRSTAKANKLNTPDTIRLNHCNGNLEHMCFELMHELGHDQARIDYAAYSKRYPLLVASEHYTCDKKYKRRIGWQMEYLSEEFEAWNQGLTLVYLNKKKFNYEAYNKYSRKQLLTYVRHFAKKLIR